MDNTKDTPMDYKTAEEILEFQLSYSSTLFSDTMRSLYNGHAIRAMKQYADQQNASLKLELQKQKELCKATIALLDNIMSDMKEEGGNVWYTDQIEELIKKSNEI